MSCTVYTMLYIKWYYFNVFIFTIDESELMDICDPQVTTDNQEIQKKIKKNDGIL